MFLSARYWFQAHRCEIILIPTFMFLLFLRSKQWLWATSFPGWIIYFPLLLMYTIRSIIKFRVVVRLNKIKKR
jgi:hypothetical protein